MQHREKFPPPSNTPPGATMSGRLLFVARILADLQVASGLMYLKPWLEGIAGSVLEIGCGAQPYRHLVPVACRYTGLDWEGAEEHFAYRVPDTVYYGGGAFPFPDATFDNIFHTQVLEHIYRDELFLSECKRVLKSGGRMFFTVPFQARYHYIPHDYRRYTPAALEIMLTTAGFRDVVVTPMGNDITVAAYKNLSIVYRWLRSGVGNQIMGICAFPFAVFFLIAGHVSLLLPVGSSDDCLGYAVKAEA